MAIAALVVVPALPAAAHVGGGPVPTNYSGVITSISAPMPGVQVSLSASGDQLELTNESAVDVTVPGYSDEPYLRIGPDGVQRNERSPATYLNATPQGETPVPDSADPEAAPEWVTLSSAPTFRWHDHRTHWMGTDLPPAVQAEPNREHLISSWEVPLSYGGQTVTIAGTLTWTPPPSSLPWTLVAVVALVAAVALGGRANWSRPMLALLVVAVVLDVLHLATTPPPDTSPVFNLLAGALPTIAAVGLAWVGWRSIRAGTPTFGYAAAIAACLVFIQSLSDVDVLWNSQLPSLGPDWLTRLAVSVGVGLGAGIALGCLRELARTRAAGQDAATATA